jgi:hypothetical protein
MKTVMCHWLLVISCWLFFKQQTTNKPKQSQTTTYYPLPITHYPLPITYYLLPITYYLLPITYYPLPITQVPDLLYLNMPQSHVDQRELQ